MNREFLYDLLSTGSVSGNEAAIEKKIYDYMQDKADQVILPGILLSALPVHNELCVSVFVLDTPGKQGIHSDVRQLTGSMGV